MPDDHLPLSDRLREVFKDVSQSISSSELRSLWEKMREEMSRDGPDAAVRYLDDELGRCQECFSREMETLDADFSQRGPS